MTGFQAGIGFTASERYLAELAERSFLKLWSYPNTFIDKKAQGGKCQGKELCDLLVVCGDHVLIFSDKSCEWPSGGDLDLCWSRWYRRAIAKSLDQINGARRWIEQFPERIFLDRDCAHRLPLALPPPDRRKVHFIVVALGAGEAAKRYFDKENGSLHIRAALRGDDHTNQSCAAYQPLTIGDINPDGPYVHVFDDHTLSVVMQELDTISDFTEYLTKRSEFGRSGFLEEAAGEENLLCWYVTKTGADDQHAFAHPEGREWQDGETLVVGGRLTMRCDPTRSIFVRRRLMRFLIPGMALSTCS